jgi:hypothetical protein
MHRSLIILTLLTLGATQASGNNASPADPEKAWREFLTRDADIEARYRFPHASCFRRASIQYDLPETLLLAVARGESDFDPTARSKANAHGVMQILWPGTANHLGIYRLSNLYDPCTNIEAGTRYLSELLDRFDGNLHLALAAYNYGPERIAARPDNIPSGATWYSSYIYRHLRYILGDNNAPRRTSPTLYSELGKSTLVEFAEPYRAAAFVARLEGNAPDVRLDWFRKGVGRFSVVMSYEDKQQFNQSAASLARAGFPLP